VSDVIGESGTTLGILSGPGSDVAPHHQHVVGEDSIPGGIVTDDGTRLLGSRCPVCGDVRYPARDLCPKDWSPTDRVPLSAEGVLYEAVRVVLAPRGFAAPYWVGYVDLPDGVRVFARVASEFGDPTHGDEIRLSFLPVENGDRTVLTPTFQTIRPGG